MKNKLHMTLFLLVLTILVPQVVLASWYNPFSWKIFSKKEILVESQNPKSIPNVDTQKLKTSNEIKTLKNKLENLKKEALKNKQKTTVVTSTNIVNKESKKEISDSQEDVITSKVATDVTSPSKVTITQNQSSNDIDKKIEELQKQIAEQTNLQKQIVVNTTPVTQVPKISKRDLQVTNLTIGDVLVGSGSNGSFKIGIKLLDDDGKQVNNPSVSMVFQNGTKTVIPSTSDNEVTYSPEKEGETTIIFTVGGLSKTLTLTAKSFTPEPPVVTFEQGSGHTLGKLKIYSASSQKYIVTEIKYNIISSSMSISDFAISYSGHTSYSGNSSGLDISTKDTPFYYNIRSSDKKGSFVFKLEYIKLADWSTGDLIKVPVDYSSPEITVE